MKKIWMDFNEPDMKNFRLHINDVKFFDLTESERVILYTEDIQVEAIVFFDSIKNQWFGKIDSDFIDVPSAIAEAREDGFQNGKLFGRWTCRNDIIREMLKHGIQREIIMKITDTNEADLKWL